MKNQNPALLSTPQFASQTIEITMDWNSWWSFITPPSPEPQTMTLKAKIVSSLSFKVIKPITSKLLSLIRGRVSL